MNKKSLPVYLYFNLNEFYQKKNDFFNISTAGSAEIALCTIGVPNSTVVKYFLLIFMIKFI